MMEHLHIIEPTLENEAGHCYSFVSTLCNAAQDIHISLWCGHKANIRLPTKIDIRRFFYRKIRKVQFLWLCRSLLKKPGRIFVSTATRTDIYLINLASAGKIAPNKVYVYVHWFKPSPAKRQQLKKLAASQPDIAIFTPTASVCEEFRAAGFTRTKHVPYPITPLASGTTSGGAQGFRHILFAGAARSDKGFSDVVDFVESLAAAGRHIPVSMQTSSEHYDKMDETTCASLARLERLRYSHLKRYTDTLQHADYSALFSGAICLQLYSQQDFADRISGVTLDALSMGSPVVTLNGTWIARVVSEFDAGLVIEASDPDTVLAAVTRIMSDYEHYCCCAFEAGRELQKRNSVDFLFRELTA
jgi:glycosyltransferase involved in cell wall biosynthesis